MAFIGTRIADRERPRLARPGRLVAKLSLAQPGASERVQFAAADRPGAAGCRLVVDHVPAVIECRACGATTTLEVPILVCSACEGSDVTLVSGEELLVASIDRAREVC